MPIDWNPTGDFTAMVDAAEPVTLLRRGSAAQVPIATAWRYSHRQSEAAQSGGYAVRSDVVWQFEWDLQAKLPELGDRLRSASGDCFTLLAVEQLQGNTRLRCESRNLRIAHGLDCRVDIEQAVWQDSGSGPEIVDWTLLRPAVHARIQMEAVTVDESVDPISSTTTCRVMLEEAIPLDHNHRFVASDGTVYRLLSYAGAEQIGELAVATVRRE